MFACSDHVPGNAAGAHPEAQVSPWVAVMRASRLTGQGPGWEDLYRPKADCAKELIEAIVACREPAW